MPHSLTKQFKDAKDVFNDAKTQTNYNNFQQYLYNPCVIERIDDVDSISGTPAYIVGIFNANEIGDWPQFILIGEPHTKEHQNKKGQDIGEVTGVATYKDHYTDLGIKIEYCLRFKKDPNTGEWVIAFALGAPI